MNKRHWITLSPGGTIDKGLVDDLVTESYLLVVNNLPRPERPVDPETFGQRSVKSEWPMSGATGDLCRRR
ncbi:MmcQ/YjbR family DNA-binding protein [Rhodococcus opacus]|uniref:MmcQ/YjbR family DNA-binding protein n=1 Tax=Rhodococcus opacus TaxID=37919 RepID=UPI003D28D78E